MSEGFSVALAVALVALLAGCATREPSEQKANALSTSGGACLALGATCSSFDQCCSESCSGTCTAAGDSRSARALTCGPQGAACSSNGDCCNADCDDGTCGGATHATCQPAGGWCYDFGDCCSLSCTAGKCDATGGAAASGSSAGPAGSPVLVGGDAGAPQGDADAASGFDSGPGDDADEPEDAAADDALEGLDGGESAQGAVQGAMIGATQGVAQQGGAAPDASAPGFARARPRRGVTTRPTACAPLYPTSPWMVCP